MHFTRDISISLIAHMGLVAAMLLTGAISETRAKQFFTVSLFDNREDVEKPRELEGDASSSLPSARQVSVAAAASHEKRLMSGQKIKSAVEAGASLHERSPEQNAVPPTEDAGIIGIEAIITEGASSSAGQKTGASGEALNVAGSSSGLGTGDSSATIGSIGRGQGGTASDLSFRQKIRGAIRSNLIYPYLARKRRMEGTVLVQFSIDHKGTAEHISVVKGSGYPILDSAARETVIKASPFPAANKTLEIPITFELKDN